MPSKFGSATSLVSESNFVLATRDSGYRSTAAAVAELIDNSLEADAQTIHVLVDNSHESGIRIAVLDNGAGMTSATLGVALQFGGSSHFNSRSGLGRYGMGLPNSSLSQCRHVDVYSWQTSGSVYVTHLDIADIRDGKLYKIPDPRRCTLPDWLGKSVGPSGTLVVWTDCDRLDNRRVSTIVQKLHLELGRCFRHFLFSGRRIFVNDAVVQPIDPLYYHPDSTLPGAQEAVPPLEYQVQSPTSDQIETIRVRFTILPIRDWYHWSAEAKRRFGISGGAGVSVVRAGREIAYGWHLLRTKRKQNYDDWWRCEVSFEPGIDEWFGVTNSKQGIRPTQELYEVLGADLVSIAQRLNARVHNEFASIRQEHERTSTKSAYRNDWRLPPVKFNDNDNHENRGRTVLKSPSEKHHPLRIEIQYAIRVRPSSDLEFFKWKLDGNILYLDINQAHPFCERIYCPIAKGSTTIGLQHLECLLLALARAEAHHLPEQREHFIKLHEAWSNALVAFLA